MSRHGKNIHDLQSSLNDSTQALANLSQTQDTSVMALLSKQSDLQLDCARRLAALESKPQKSASQPQFRTAFVGQPSKDVSPRPTEGSPVYRVADDSPSPPTALFPRSLNLDQRYLNAQSIADLGGVDQLRQHQAAPSVFRVPGYQPLGARRPNGAAPSAVPVQPVAHRAVHPPVASS